MDATGPETTCSQPSASLSDEAASPESDKSLLSARDAPENLHVPDDWQVLPRNPYSKNPRIHTFLYRGMVLHNMHLRTDAPRFWARYKGRPSDVVVASFPKSGTTWLQEIVWRVVHHETGPESGNGKTLEYRFPLLDLPPFAEMQRASLHDMKSPRLIKTHLMYHLLPESMHTSGAKLLYVSRDPRDVCVSSYNFHQMMKTDQYRGPFAHFRDMFVKGEVLPGPYREHVRGYVEHADTVLCVTYEMLHEDRVAVVHKIAEFLGKSVTDSEAVDIARYTDFDNMRKNPACNFRHWEKSGILEAGEECKFMRKGKVGDWRNYFTKKESDDFMKWANEMV